MKYSILLAMLMAMPAAAQDMEKDTIQLEEIAVSNKKPKFKKVVLGSNRNKILPSASGKHEYSYLIKDIPKGRIQKVFLFFGNIRKSMEPGKRFLEKYTIFQTEYELNFYEITGNKIGKRINDATIRLLIDEGHNDKEIKLELDFTKYRITTQFLLHLKMVSMIPCNECYFYVPSLYLSSERLTFYENIEDIQIDAELPYKTTNTGLKAELLVLIQD